MMKPTSVDREPTYPYPPQAINFGTIQILENGELVTKHVMVTILNNHNTPIAAQFDASLDLDDLKDRVVGLTQQLVNDHIGRIGEEAPEFYRTRIITQLNQRGVNSTSIDHNDPQTTRYAGTHQEYGRWRDIETAILNSLARGRGGSNGVASSPKVHKPKGLSATGKDHAHSAIPLPMGPSIPASSTSQNTSAPKKPQHTGGITSPRPDSPPIASKSAEEKQKQEDGDLIRKLLAYKAGEKNPSLSRSKSKQPPTALGPTPGNGVMINLVDAPPKKPAHGIQAPTRSRKKPTLITSSRLGLPGFPPNNSGTMIDLLDSLTREEK